jgi:FkbM family methyltransferase
MENVGESQSRNDEFKGKFTREKLLYQIVKNESPNIFDIGAHHGESVVFLKKVFPNAHIYSFEPDPESFSILSGAAIDGVSYFNLAFSDADGESNFYRNKISHTNSLLKVNERSQDSIGISKALNQNDLEYFEKFNHKISVKTETVDSFLTANPLDKIDLLKIDVQGAERLVLRGASKTLSKVKVIIIEVSFYDYYEQQSSFLDVEKIIAPCGFKLFSISEISNNPMNGRTDWAEVVYVNTYIQ